MSKATTNLTPQPDRTSGNSEPGLAQSTARAPRQRGRRAERLVISANGPDQEALRSVIQDWLVPLLVEQFLTERGLKLPQNQTRSAFLQSGYQALGQGGRATKRVDEAI